MEFSSGASLGPARPSVAPTRASDAPGPTPLAHIAELPYHYPAWSAAATEDAMPVCGRLERWDIFPTDVGLRFAAIPHRSARTPVDFADMLQRLLPTWSIRVRGNGDLVGKMRGAGGRQRGEAETVLFLLETSVTIEDRADASHALRIHDAIDENANCWAHSDIGKLVRAAKSYDRSSGDRRKARQLADEMLNWVEDMPLYRDADMIVPAPSSNPDKVFDLPAFVAKHLSSRMRRPRIQIRSSNTAPQKKSSEKSSESKKLTADELARRYTVVGNVQGRTVLIIDDIYESGATVGAMTKVLRNAGASAVLSLTATKTAADCRGLRPSTDNWPLEA